MKESVLTALFLGRIVSALLLPIALAAVLYFFDWRPAGQPHGELIDPPAPMELGGGIQESAGRWSVVLLSDAPCGETCVRRLDELLRLRLAMGREARRMRIVWAGAGVGSEVEALATALPAGAQGIAAVDRDFRVNAAWPAGSLVVVDPLGRAMMRYPPGAPLRGVHADLARLMKVGG